MLVGIYKSFSEDNTMRLAAATLTRALPITLLNLILTLSSQSLVPFHYIAMQSSCYLRRNPVYLAKKLSNLQTLTGVKQLAKRITLIRYSSLTWYLKIRNIIFSLRFFFANHNFGAIVSPFSFPSFFNFYVPLPPCPSLPASHITLHLDTHIIAIIRPFKYRE